MALSRLFRRRSSSIFDDPLPLDNVWDPFQDSRLWDPFQGFSSLGSRQFPQEVAALANTREDWFETPDAHIFTANLPGLKKEEITVQVVPNGILQIRGECRKENVERTDRWYRVETSSGSFFRSFQLPDNANVDDLKTQVENGILTIKVPKQPAAHGIKAIRTR